MDGENEMFNTSMCECEKTKNKQPINDDYLIAHMDHIILVKKSIITINYLSIVKILTVY